MFTENKVEATMNGMRSPTTKDRQSWGSPTYWPDAFKDMIEELIIKEKIKVANFWCKIPTKQR